MSSKKRGGGAWIYQGVGVVLRAGLLMKNSSEVCRDGTQRPDHLVEWTTALG